VFNRKKAIPQSFFFDDETPEATELKRLYSKIKRKGSKKKSDSLLITSASMGEGKSTVSSLLAITMAKSSESKTLLIDCDLRRPKIHELMEMKMENGFSDVLSGEKTFNECVKETWIDNLKVLTAGELVDKPSALLKNQKFDELVSDLKHYFNHIVLDCPPVLPVSDSLILGKHADGIFMVVRVGKTRKELVERAKSLIHDASLEIAGVILNNVEEILPFYYNYKYYGYSYK